MVTTTCTLTFRDGQKVSARVSVETPYDARHVIYSGPVQRLPERFEKTSPPVLRVLFRQLAEQLHAELSIVEEGHYDVEE